MIHDIRSIVYEYIDKGTITHDLLETIPRIEEDYIPNSVLLIRVNHSSDSGELVYKHPNGDKVYAYYFDKDKLSVGYRRLLSNINTDIHSLPTTLIMNMSYSVEYAYMMVIKKTSPKPPVKIYSTNDHPDFKELTNNVKKNNKYNSLKKYLDKYTFGFEIETSSGNLEEKQEQELGFVKLYDGSITGHEYASVPFNYSTLDNVTNFCKLLKTSGHRVNSTCSTHIHIGNIPFTDQNLLSLYLIFYRLQDELHELCSPYKKDIRFLSQKKDLKDHCKYLVRPLSNNVQDIYKILFSNFNGALDIGTFPSSESEELLRRTSKWNVMSRYYYVNFTNYIMKMRNNTVELRLLQGTFNSDRILFWLLINIAIIEYALNNSLKIIDSKEKISISDCVSYYYGDNDSLLSVINSHIVEVKTTNYDSKLRNDIRISDEYFDNDMLLTKFKL